MPEGVETPSLSDESATSAPQRASAAPARPVSRASAVLRSTWLWLFVFALLFRLVYIAESTRNPLYGVHLVDARTYDDWAREMARGNWLWNRVENYLPIYPIFLALHKVALGDNPIFVKWTQALMGAMTAVLLGVVGARAFGNRWIGWLGGFFVAVNWLSVVYESEEFAEPFSVFFMALALWVLSGRGGRRFAYSGQGGQNEKSKIGWTGALLSGIALALAAGARANLMLLLPFAALWIVWKGIGEHGPRNAGALSGPSAALPVHAQLATRDSPPATRNSQPATRNSQPLRQWRRAVLGAVAFGVGASLVLSPILLRNHRLTGAWMLRRQASWSLYSGIDPRFEGLPIPPGVAFDNYMRLPLQQGLRSEVEIERFWSERAARVLREEPLGVARVVARRLLMFLSAQEFCKEFDAYAYRSYSRLLSLPWPGFWFVGPLGILGICLWRRWSKETVLLAIFLVVGVASIVPFKFADRYRLPNAPLLALFAAAAIGRMAEWTRAKRWRPLAFALAWLALLCSLSWPDWLGLRERRIARHDFFVGLHLKESGRADEALEAFRRSMRDYAWDADSPRHAAEILIDAGRLDEAETMANEALRREPDFPEAMFALGRIALERNDPARAQEWAGRGLDLFPNSQSGLILMARIANREGKSNEEIEYYRQALREGAGETTVLTLALRLEDVGRLDEALGFYEQVLNEKRADDFHRARAAMLAGNLLARRRGDLPGARKYWSIVRDRFPSETLFADQARFLLGEIDEAQYYERLGPNRGPLERCFAHYVVGFRRRLAGDRAGALEAYRRCLGVRAADKEPLLPQNWAREDMEALGDSRAKTQRGKDAKKEEGQTTNLHGPSGNLGERRDGLNARAT